MKGWDLVRRCQVLGENSCEASLRGGKCSGQYIGDLYMYCLARELALLVMQ